VGGLNMIIILLLALVVYDMLSKHNKIMKRLDRIEKIVNCDSYFNNGC